MAAFNPTLYSLKADPAIIPVIQRIAGKHDFFATFFMGPDLGETPIATRLEAWRNPQTKLWQIDRVTYISGSSNPDDAHVKKEPYVKPGICFFDALHLCSSFEYSEKMKGNKIFPLEIDGDQNIPVSWQYAAKSAGQAVDADGLVQACAFGRILVDGTFHKNQFAIASQSNGPESREIGLPQESLVNDFMSELSSRPPSEEKTPALIATVQNRIAEAQKYQDLRDLGDKILNAFKISANNNFESDFRGPILLKRGGDIYMSATIPSVVTLGLLPLYKFAKGDVEYFPEFMVKERCQAFNKAANQLAEPTDRDRCLTFGRDAMFAFYLGRAQSTYPTEGKKKIKLGDIEKAGKVAGLSDIDLERLKAEYIDTGFKGSEYYSRLNYRWNSIERKFLSEKIKEIEATRSLG